MRTQIRVRQRFCAGLSLRDPRLSAEENEQRFKRWAGVHGHDFTLTVVVTGPINERTQCVMDYSALHRLIQREVYRPLDHRYLNETDLLRDVVPTSENIARVLFERLAECLPRRVELVSITLEDADGNAAIVSGD